MGYHTDFQGHFAVTPALLDVHIAYLKQFSETRRMKRDPEEAEKIDDPIRASANLSSIGVEAGYFVGGGGYAGQDRDVSVLDSNRPPQGQPGLWCQWTPTSDGNTIEWDGGEKFYDYVKWIQYLIQHFLKPWGYTLNGVVNWRGQDFNDNGSIVIVNNKVSTK